MKRLLLLLTGVLSVLSAMATDFSYEYEGQTLNYTIIDDEARTCMTKAGSLSQADSQAGNNVSGDLVIPSVAIYNDMEFTVVSIGDLSFNESELTSVKIPNSVTTIGYGAFLGCSSLTSIELPNSVTTIEGAAFYLCSSLTSIELPNSLTTIEEAAFYLCSSLTSIELPNSLTEIGAYAFYCSSLTSIELPNSLTSIKEYTFDGCRSLTSIELPKSLTTIENNAFDGCRSLTSIELPNSVTSIEKYTFSGCRSLTSIELPKSLTTIENNAFTGCSSLTSIELPNSVTTIGYRAFLGCRSLTSIELPESLTTIGNSAFAGCSSLTSIECNAVVPPSVDQSSFDEDVYSTAELLVPLDAEEAYRNDEVWSLFSIRGVERPILVSELSVDPTEWTGGVGEEFRITATVLPADATCKTLEWSTSDPAVAEVSDDGVVTVTGTGECEITVSTVDGSGLTATCHVKVESAGIEGVFEYNDHIRVYTPGGVCIYDGAADEASLSPGMYIVITADRVEKVVIK